MSFLFHFHGNSSSISLCGFSVSTLTTTPPTNDQLVVMAGGILLSFYVGTRGNRGEGQSCLQAVYFHLTESGTHPHTQRERERCPEEPTGHHHVMSTTYRTGSSLHSRSITITFAFSSQHNSLSPSLPKQQLIMHARGLSSRMTTVAANGSAPCQGPL